LYQGTWQKFLLVLGDSVYLYQSHYYQDQGLRLVTSSTSLLATLTCLRIPVDYLDSLHQAEMLQGDS